MHVRALIFSFAPVSVAAGLSEAYYYFQGDKYDFRAYFAPFAASLGQSKIADGFLKRKAQCRHYRTAGYFR